MIVTSAEQAAELQRLLPDHVVHWCLDPVDLPRSPRVICVPTGAGSWTRHQLAIWRLAAEIRGVAPYGRSYRRGLTNALGYHAVFPSLPGVGSTRPDLVLVGEQPNPRTLDRTRGVPFAFGGAGEWLTRALSEASARGWCPRVYVTNAIKHDGNEVMVAQEIRLLQASCDPHVVALGKIASSILTKHRITHAMIDHPQHARRFHHHESYADQLAQAVAA